MANKLAVLLVLATVFILSGISSASSLNSTTNISYVSAGWTEGRIDKDVSTRFNITLTTNETDSNVTSVTFTLLSGINFITQSNSTSLANWVFTNTTNALVWTYIPSDPSATRVYGNASHNFKFNITTDLIGSQSLFINLSVNINDTGTPITYPVSINRTQTRQNLSDVIIVNYGFSGFVRNESGFVSNANVTAYKVTQTTDGPPVESFLQSVLTDSAGFFTVRGLNGSGYASEQLTTKIIYYNQSALTQAVAVGPLLPSMPGMMFARRGLPAGMNTFMLPPSINGTTHELQSATTLLLVATNGSTGEIRFGYQVMDAASNFPIASAINANVSSVSVVVPTGRSVTAMVVRSPTIFTPGPSCTGANLDNGSCPSVPRSAVVTAAQTLANGTGSTITLNFSLVTTTRYLSGCIGVTGNTTNITNITMIYPRMMPMAGFIPPIRADTGEINLTTFTATYNNTDPRCPSAIAFYNVSLLNAEYLIDFYGANNSAKNLGGVNIAQTFGWVQNVSLTSADINWFNITLRPMLGSWQAAGLGEINTSKIKFNFTNSTGSLLTAAPNLELVVYYPHTGKLRYMIETSSVSSGATYFPIVNVAGVWAKVNAFGQGPPVEKSVSMTSSVTQVAVDDGSGFGFRRMLADGTINNTADVVAMPIQMRFLKNNATCNVVNPPDGCAIQNMSAANFNPFKLMTAGKINLELKHMTSNLSITYINFDMFQAKPPTNTIFDLDPSTAGRVQSWQFGGYAPVDAYDNVTIGMPYDPTVVSEARDIFVKVPTLYDDNMGVVWDRSAGNTEADLPTGYTQSKSADFNSSGFRDYLSATGMGCTQTDTNLASLYCYADKTSNVIYMKLPHFSGAGPTVTGTAASSAATTGGGSGGGGGGGIGDSSSTVVLASIAAGSPAIIAVDGSKLGISEVLLDVLKDATSVAFTVTKLASKPASVDAAEGAIYSYFNLHTNLNNANIKSATIRFQVTKKWLADNSIDKNTVSLQRWETSKWTGLGTKLLSEDSANVFYSAETTGFSIFAVIGEKLTAAATTQAPAGTKQTAAAGKQALLTAPPSSTTAILVVLLIIVIGVIAYTLMPKRRYR